MSSLPNLWRYHFFSNERFPRVEKLSIVYDYDKNKENHECLAKYLVHEHLQGGQA